MNRLRKRDVEALLGAYDLDPEAALTAALAVVLERSGSFDDLVRASGFPAAREAALIAREPSALDDLAAELNELRTLAT